MSLYIPIIYSFQEEKKKDDTAFLDTVLPRQRRKLFPLLGEKRKESDFIL